MTDHAPLEPVPRFCTECRAALTDRAWDRPFCGRCGGPLIEQGYCTICERHWRLSAGQKCPKHEITLEDHTPWAALDAAVGPVISWQTVQTFPHSLAAAAARIRLEAEGIPTFLDGEHSGTHELYQVSAEGVRLQVPAQFADEARVILNQTWMFQEPDEIDDDLEYAWEDLGPEAHLYRRAAEHVMLVMSIIMLLLTVGSIGVYLFFRVTGTL